MLKTEEIKLLIEIFIREWSSLLQRCKQSGFYTKELLNTGDYVLGLSS